jgi:hypothetical protein
MAMGFGIAGESCDSSLKAALCGLYPFQSLFAVVPKATEHQFVTGDILIGRSARTVADFDLDPAHERICDDAGDFVLQGKDIRNRAVVVIGPAGGAACGFREPRGNAYAAIGFADASREHEIRLQFFTCVRDGSRRIAQCERGFEADDRQDAKAAQAIDDIAGYAIGKIELLGIAAEIVEWQDSDYRLTGRALGGCGV